MYVGMAVSGSSLLLEPMSKTRARLIVPCRICFLWYMRVECLVPTRTLLVICTGVKITWESRMCEWNMICMIIV